MAQPTTKVRWQGEPERSAYGVCVAAGRRRMHKSGSFQDYRPEDFPEVSRWLRRCVGCGFVGRLPETDTPGFADNKWMPVLAEYPLLTEGDLCPQCAATVTA